MKKITTFITLFVLIVMAAGSSAAPVFAATYPCSPTVVYPGWEGCEPSVQLGGTISTDKYSAIVTATYNSNGSNYNDFSQYTPTMSIEYGPSGTNSYNKSVTVCKDNQSNNNNGQTVTALCKQNKGSRTSVFYIDGLTEGKKYQYRARLDWVGGTKYSGEVKEFTAVKAIMPTDTSTTTTPTTSTTTTNTTTNTTVAPSTVPKSGGIFGIFGGTTTTTTPKTTSRFNNVDEKSGFKLAIDNGETQVHQGDTVTIKVRYENNSTKSYSDGTIDIYLPDQYTFETSNKGIYDKVDHVVAISLRDFPAGGFGTAIVSAKATGKAGDLDQAMSQASMKVAGISLKVSDVDEYVAGSGSGSILGASASGTGFLPASLIGWIVLFIILAGIVIIGRRYFVKKDY